MVEPRGQVPAAKGGFERADRRLGRRSRARRERRDPIRGFVNCHHLVLVHLVRRERGDDRAHQVCVPGRFRLPGIPPEPPPGPLDLSGKDKTELTASLGSELRVDEEPKNAGSRFRSTTPRRARLGSVAADRQAMEARLEARTTEERDANEFSPRGSTRTSRSSSRGARSSAPCPRNRPSPLGGGTPASPFGSRSPGPRERGSSARPIAAATTSPTPCATPSLIPARSAP